MYCLFRLFHKCFHTLLGEFSQRTWPHTHIRQNKTKKCKKCKKCPKTWWKQNKEMVVFTLFGPSCFHPLNPFFIITGTTGCQWWTGQWVSCSLACIGRLVRSTCHGGHLWFLICVYIYIQIDIYTDIFFYSYIYIYIYLGEWWCDIMWHGPSSEQIILSEILYPM